MTQEEFFEAENIRNQLSAAAYRDHLKAIQKLQKTQVDIAAKTYKLLLKLATPQTIKPVKTKTGLS